MAPLISFRISKNTDTTIRWLLDSQAQRGFPTTISNIARAALERGLEQIVREWQGLADGHERLQKRAQEGA